MSVRCGNPKCANDHRHETIAEVRECYKVATVELPGLEPTTLGHNPPSTKQLDYVESLLSERVWHQELTRDDLIKMTRPQVSALITGLKSAQHKPVEVKVPPGRYAILEAIGSDTDADGTGEVVSFYQLELWNDRVYLKQLYGSPGDFAKHPVYGHRARGIIAEIERDPQEASLRFGREVGVCGVCGSPLTNAESRELGIGPVCSNKQGWS